MKLLCLVVMLAAGLSLPAERGPDYSVTCVGKITNGVLVEHGSAIRPLNTYGNLADSSLLIDKIVIHYLDGRVVTNQIHVHYWTKSNTNVTFNSQPPSYWYECHCGARTVLVDRTASDYTIVTNWSSVLTNVIPLRRD